MEVFIFNTLNFLHCSFIKYFPINYALGHRFQYASINSYLIYKSFISIYVTWILCSFWKDFILTLAILAPLHLFLPFIIHILLFDSQYFPACNELLIYTPYFTNNFILPLLHFISLIILESMFYAYTVNSDLLKV